MAKFYDALNEDLRDFIAEQKLFFTATAPENGRINISPKGMDTFRCLSDNQVAYLDLTGSGNEASAHLRQNSRMTIMFCSFTKRPLILRLYGQGRVVYPHHADWDNFMTHFTPIPGMRQIVTLTVESVQTSCGFAVPFYEFKEERPTLQRYAENKGPEGMVAYRQEKNLTSIDGEPTGLAEAMTP